MAKGKEVAVVPTGTSNLPATLQEEIAKDVAALANRTAPVGGDFIKLTKAKEFKLPDGTLSKGPLGVVIVDFVSTNLYYDKPYADGDVTPPACFAIGLDPMALVPSNNAPAKQADKCQGCPQNEWGSSTKGNRKGKACTNTRILAVMEPTDDPDAPVYLIKVSPTGIKAFDAYVQTVKAKFQLPQYGVITEIYFDEGSEHQSLRFGNPKPNLNMAATLARKAAVRERLLQEPDVSSYEAPKPAARARR